MVERVNITLNKRLLDEIDEKRGNTTRSEYIQSLIIEAMLKEKAGESNEFQGNDTQH